MKLLMPKDDVYSVSIITRNIQKNRRVDTVKLVTL